MFRQPVVEWGRRIADAVPALTAELNRKRVLPVVTGSLAHDADVVSMLRAMDGLLPPFTSLKPHTPLEVVVALMERLRLDEPDALVVVGGGSAIDAAKVATAAAAAGARDRKGLLDLRAVPDSRGKTTEMEARRAFPVIAVPTTLSAAEFGIIAGATDVESGLKVLFRSPDLAPEYIVYDPHLTTRTPRDLWLSTGVRALDHGIETVLSIDATPMTDAMALRGIGLIAKGLGRNVEAPDEPAGHNLAQLGAWLCGSSIGRVRYGASHGIGHQLGAVAGVPHGITSCVLLPAVLEFNRTAVAERQRWLSEALGRGDTSASLAVRELIDSLGLPTRLSQIGLSPGSYAAIAESSLSNPFVRANPREITDAAEIVQILQAAA